MRDAMAQALKDALGCTVYQETVPQGLEAESCVILARAHTVHAQTPHGIPVTVRYTVIARGCAVELVCKALSCVTDGEGNRFRAVRLGMKMHEDRAEAPELTIVPLRLTELKDGTDYRPVIAEGDEADRIVNRILKRSSKMEGFENGGW